MRFGGERITKENDKVDLVVFDLYAYLLFTAQIAGQEFVYVKVGHLFYETARSTCCVYFVL